MYEALVERARELGATNAELIDPEQIVLVATAGGVIGLVLRTWPSRRQTS